jgi:hypothetical protein
MSALGHKRTSNAVAVKLSVLCQKEFNRPVPDRTSQADRSPADSWPISWRLHPTPKEIRPQEFAEWRRILGKPPTRLSSPASDRNGSSTSLFSDFGNVLVIAAATFII